jgi:hypothetical protein
MDHLPYFRDSHDGFNHCDVDRVLGKTSVDVDWPNARQGGRPVARDAVRYQICDGPIRRTNVAEVSR